MPDATEMEGHLREARKLSMSDVKSVNGLLRSLEVSHSLLQGAGIALSKSIYVASCRVVSALLPLSRPA